jgi:LAO/AO transport system kinase
VKPLALSVEIAVIPWNDFFVFLCFTGEETGCRALNGEHGDVNLGDQQGRWYNIEKATKARILYQSALHLFPPSPSGWTPAALTASAIEETGLEEILDAIFRYMDLTKSNGYFFRKRKEQAVYWMKESIDESLLSRFYNNPNVTEALTIIEKQVAAGETDPFEAAGRILNII